MIIENNYINAENGKVLLFKGHPFSNLCIGKSLLKIDNKVDWYNVSENDVIEALPIKILNDIYYLKSTDYKSAVSELIHTKYSIDDELALIANARLGYSDKESEYQSWRRYCKDLAKLIYE